MDLIKRTRKGREQFLQTPRIQINKRKTTCRFEANGAVRETIEPVGESAKVDMHDP